MSRFYYIAGLNAPTERQIEHSLGVFSELLSRDLSLRDIAAEMDVTPGTSCVLLRMLCERIGAQAQ